MNHETIERLALYSHKSWALRLKKLFKESKENPDGSITIPAELVQMLKRRVLTEYRRLNETEKVADRQEALKILEEIEPVIKRLEKENRKFTYATQQLRDEIDFPRSK